MVRTAAPILVLGLFLLSTWFGFWQGSGHTTDASSAIPLRLPAHTSADFEEISPDPAAQELLKKAFIQNLKLWDEDQESKILPPPLEWVTETGEKIGLCEEFPRLIFVFSGEGVVSHGQKPSLEWEWDCQMDEALNPLPLVVDRGSIVQQEPFEGEWELPQGHGLMRFFNTVDAWPAAWALEHIYFENQQGVSTLEISAQDLMKFRPRPLGLRWKM